MKKLSSMNDATKKKIDFEGSVFQKVFLKIEHLDGCPETVVAEQRQERHP
jgi:hypothetical protein